MSFFGRGNFMCEMYKRKNEQTHPHFGTDRDGRTGGRWRGSFIYFLPGGEGGGGSRERKGPVVAPPPPKRADNRGRSGLGCADVSAQKRPGEIAPNGSSRAQVEGLRCVSLKVSWRIPRLSLGMTDPICRSPSH